MDSQTKSCLAFCKAIVGNHPLALRPNVIALLESFWERCRQDETMEKWIRVLGVRSEAIYFEQRAIVAREATLDLGPPSQEEQCVFCGGSGYSVADGTVDLCKSCLGIGWKFG